jgi:hypothetical protein
MARAPRVVWIGHAITVSVHRYRRRMHATMRRLWEGRRSALVCLILGIVLALPSLKAGFFLDDYLQIAQLESWSRAPAPPYDLFAFTPRDSGGATRLIEAGAAPFFTAPHLRIAFLRPLPSLLTWADHAIFRRNAFAAHVHTLLWYGALLAAAALLLSRLLPGRLGLLALLLFCVDDGHAMTVTFVAARNAVVATVFSFFGLWAHIRWREERWRPGCVLAPVLVALGLASGEMALGALSYLVAWELVTRRPGWRRGLLPTVALAVIYVVAYTVTHSGTRLSGSYLDPFGDPAGFLRALPGRALMLLASLFFSAPVDFAPMEPRLGPPLIALGVVACAGLILWLPRALRRMDEGEARTVRWMGLGAAGSLVVGAPALLGDRVLLAAGLGGAVIIAALARDAWRLFRQRQRLVGAVIGLAALGLPNLVVSTLALPGKIVILGALFADSRRIARQAEIEAPVPARVVVIAMDDLLAIDLPAVRAVEQGRPPAELTSLLADGHGAGGALPDRIGYLGTTALSLAATNHRLRRTAANEFELATPEGTLLDGVWATTLRRPSLSLPRGSVVKTPFMTVTVLDDRDGLPTRASFRFDRSLDDPSLVFLVARPEGLRRLTWPPLGLALDLPRWSTSRASPLGR